VTKYFILSNNSNLTGKNIKNSFKIRKQYSGTSLVLTGRMRLAGVKIDRQNPAGEKTEV
jgi:hypothetical protein